MSDEPKNGAAPEEPATRWLSIKDAAAATGLSTKTVFRRIHEGLVPQKRKGKSVLVDMDALLALETQNHERQETAALSLYREVRTYASDLQVAYLELAKHAASQAVKHGDHFKDLLGLLREEVTELRAGRKNDDAELRAVRELLDEMCGKHVERELEILKVQGSEERKGKALATLGTLVVA